VLRLLLASAAAAYFAAFGLLALVWPGKVRGFYLRQYTRGLDDLERLGLPLSWRPRLPPEFVFRLFGVMSLAASGLIVYGLLRS
jgi:hypothetical protein